MTVKPLQKLSKIKPKGVTLMVTSKVKMHEPLSFEQIKSSRHRKPPGLRRQRIDTAAESLVSSCFNMSEELERIKT
jgi:hypothetical protein